MPGWAFSLFSPFRKPLAELLDQILKPSDPRVAISVCGNDWLCPFTGKRVLAPSWDGSPATVTLCPEICSHLLSLPVLQQKGTGAPMRDLNELVRITIRTRLERCPNYKISTPTGQWICPYCMEKTDVLVRAWDDTEVEADLFVPDALRHFAACNAYAADPLRGAKTNEEIVSSGGERARLAQALTTDLRFRVCDNAGTWICPFSARPVPHINLKTEPWSENLQNRMLDYLLGPDCPGKYTRFEVERTLAQLEQAARGDTPEI